MNSRWLVQGNGAGIGRRFGLVLLFVLAIGLLSLPPREAGAAGAIFYVKPGAGGSGFSWADAASLQGALGTATSGDEIWVAAGEYVPGTAESDSFQLAPGVGVYGGFAGTETALEERDWVANLTVLSGDIGGDDANKVNGVVTDTADITGDNSIHVVVADGTTGTPITEATVLDGFTITAGQANGEYPDVYGGGFYCDGHGGGSECSPSLSHVSFSGNTAGAGGAMYNSGYNGGSSSPSLTNVSFASNTAGEHGGAMYNDGSWTGSASPSLTNVILWGDSATEGPEIYNYEASTTISSSLIAGGVGSIIDAIDGGGNLDDDPLFVDSATDDLLLQFGSPAIDAGDNSAPGLSGIAVDLDGSDRFVDGDGDAAAAVDMGAYEAQIQAIGLAGGWNLVSLYREPDDPALETALAGMETEVVLLKNGLGEVYWPAYGINQIGGWQVGNGYQVYLNAPATLFASGMQVDPALTPLPLGTGWNMAAYLCDDSMPVETALDSISEELLLVKDGDGNVYWPDLGLNFIGDMVPGQGYQIFMESGGTLLYPGS